MRGVLAFALICPAHAIAADAPLTVFAAQRFVRDSNVYRLASSTDPEPITGRSARGDRVSTTAAGARLDTEQSRQRVRVAAAASLHRYDRFSELDHTGRELAAQWLWRAGNPFEGEIAADERVSLTPFQDFRPTGRVTAAGRTTYRSAGGTANFWFLPDWSIGGGGGWLETRYSAPELASARWHGRYGEAIARYRPPTGSAITARYRRTDGRFPDRVAPADGSTQVSRAFIQDELLAETTWQASGVSRVEIGLGLTERRVGNFVGPAAAPRAADFRGPTGRIAYDWELSGATGLNIALARTAQPIQSNDADYAVTTSIALVPTWQATPALRVQPRFERLHRDLRGGVSNGRSDRLDSVGLRIIYTPLPRLELVAGALRERRHADVTALEFQATQYWIEGRYAFY